MRTLSPKGRGGRTFVRTTCDGEPAVPTTANPGPILLLVSDGRGPGSIDRVIRRIE